MEKSKVYIYHIVCNSTGKGYIGSTINVYKRKSGHFEQLKKNIHVNTYLQRAFNKYGIENFTFNVIFSCCKNYRNKIEEWFINKSDYNSEFNLLLTDRKDYSIENNLKRLKKEDILSIKNYIEQGYNAIEISNIMNIGKNTIGKVIKNKYYLDVQIPTEIQKLYKFNIANSRKKLQRDKALEIYVYKINGDFIGKFNSIPDAAENLNFNKNSVSNALNRGIQLKGYLFYRESKKFSEYIPAQTSPKRVIYVFNKNFKLVLKSISMRDCAKELDINVNRINSSCNRLTSSKDYYFVRDKDINEFMEKYEFKDRLILFGTDKVSLRMLDNQLGS